MEAEGKKCQANHKLVEIVHEMVMVHGAGIVERSKNAPNKLTGPVIMASDNSLVRWSS